VRFTPDIAIFRVRFTRIRRLRFGIPPHGPPGQPRIDRSIWSRLLRLAQKTSAHPNELLSLTTVPIF
jgi:hypothetical protein